MYFTTSGPGAVNGLGGLADAWFDGFPIMGICGNVPTNEMKGFSDIVSRAYNMALLGRKGGVIIDFPLDIQQADITCR